MLTTIANNHNLNKFIALLLIIAILSVSFCFSLESAEATIVLSGDCADVDYNHAIYVAGSILAAAGVDFEGYSDMSQFAANYINTCAFANGLIADIVASGTSLTEPFTLDSNTLSELEWYLGSSFEESEAGSTSGTLSLPATFGHLTLTYRGSDFDVPYIPFIPNVDISQINNYDFSAVPYLSDLLLSNGFTFDSSDFVVVLPFPIYQNYRAAFLADGFYTDGSPVRHFDSSYTYYKCFEMGYSKYSPFSSFDGNNFGAVSKLFFTESNGTYYFVIDGPGITDHLLPLTSYVSVVGSSSGVASASAAADSTFFPSSGFDNELFVSTQIQASDEPYSLGCTRVGYSGTGGGGQTGGGGAGRRPGSTGTLTNIVDPDDPTSGSIGSSIDFPILGDIWDIVSSGFIALSSALDEIIDSICDIATGVLDTISDTVSDISTGIGGFFTGLLDGIKLFFSGIPAAILSISGFLSDIVGSLAGFIGSILAFIPDILAFIGSFALFEGLISKFIPQPVAVVMIAFFLATCCIWLFRWILNR